MSQDETEYLLFGGESPANRAVFQRYLAEVQRGKSLLPLEAVAQAITPEIRRSWSARSFTPIKTSHGSFDEVVCNIAYHFQKHGQKYGNIQRMTEEALQVYREHRHEAKTRKSNGLVAFPDGSLFEPTGKMPPAGSRGGQSSGTSLMRET
jgi:hypothetical protein